MPGPAYHFVTRCTVRATPEEVTEVLADPAELERWWRSVYLRVELLDPGGLRLELARRRAAGDPPILRAIPPPPGPTFPHRRRRR